MKRLLSSVIAVLVVLPRLAAAETEADLIAILQSNARGPEKCTACFKLKLVGTARCVPALAALLGDDAVSHAARNALEGLPFPEAGNALRTALATTSGLTRAGVIDSLGWRGEAASAPLLAPMLHDPLPEIATAAATALGRLATPDAAAALAEARDDVGPVVQPIVLEAILRAADRLVARHSDVAAALYRDLYDGDYPPEIRAAAGRKLVRTNPELLTDPDNLNSFKAALAGTDRFLRAAALALLRELDDPKTLESLLGHWPGLSPETQLALLDTCVRLKVSAVPTARKAAQSQVPAVRIAAWEALADLNDLESVAALLQAAFAEEAAERSAARESLTRLRGDAVLSALTQRLEEAEPHSKVELLQVLGERGDPGAAGVLLRYAADTEPTRTAALRSLARLGAPTLLPRLLELAAKASPDQDAGPLLQALLATLQSSPDRDRAANQVTEAMNRFGPVARRQILPLLSELGTTPALTLALEAANNPDRELQKVSLQVLGQWPSAAPAPRLLELAEQADDPAVQILALRGAVETVGLEPDVAARLQLFVRALAAARRLEERKLVLGRIGHIPTPAALALLVPNLEDPNLAEEAAVAALTVAEKIATAQPQLAMETTAHVLKVARNADALKRAWALRGETIQPGPFINHWLVCGPFRQSGATNALTIFDLPLGPEKEGEGIEWRAVRGTDLIELSALFPGQDGCAAYLKCQVVAPRALNALLLVGSDDGVKAWLNGKVVHANNTDRGWAADQDAASVRLWQGTNEFMFKITQGGGGWVVSARLVGTDGKPISDLQVVPVPASVPAAQPQAAPTPQS